MNNTEKRQLAIEMIEAVDKVLTRNGIWYSLSYGSALGAYREHGFIEWDLDIDIIITIEDQNSAREHLSKELPKEFYVLSCDKDNVSSYDKVVKKGVFEGNMHVDIYPLIGGPDDPVVGHKYQLKCRRIHKLANCKYVKLKRLVKKWKIPFVILIKAIEMLIPDKIIRAYIFKLAHKYSFKDANYVFPFANDGKPGEYMEKEILTETQRIQFENLELPVPKRIEEYLTKVYGDNYMTPIQY